jgi:hypothetical protein
MPQRHTLCKGFFFANIPGQVSPSASQIPIEYFVPLPKTATALPEVKDPDGAATASGTARRAVWLYELEAERSDFCMEGGHRRLACVCRKARQPHRQVWRSIAAHGRDGHGPFSNNRGGCAVKNGTPAASGSSPTPRRARHPYQLFSKGAAAPLLRLVFPIALFPLKNKLDDCPSRSKMRIYSLQ